MLVLASQIFSVVLAIIAISKSYVDFRAKRESVQMFVLWTATWCGIVVIAIFPRIVDFVIRSFGSGNAGIGTFFGMGMVLLYFLVYRIYARLDRLDQQLSTLVQKLALQRDMKIKDQ